MVHGNSGTGSSATSWVFNGTVDGGSIDADVDDAKEIAARITASPWIGASSSSLRGAVLGLAVTRGSKRGTADSPYVASYRTVGQNVFFRYLGDDDDEGGAGGAVRASGLHARFSPQLYVPVGPLAVLGEYTVSQQRVARGSESRLLLHRAWAVTLAWAITGEQAHFEGVDPKRALDVARGHWGALELVVRGGALELDRETFPTMADPGASARSATEAAVGLNWHANHTVRISVDGARTWFRGGAPRDDGGSRPTEHALLLRGQFLF